MEFQPGFLGCSGKCKQWEQDPCPKSRDSGAHRGKNSREISCPCSKIGGIFWQLLPVPRGKLGNQESPRSGNFGNAGDAIHGKHSSNSRTEQQDGRGKPGHPSLDSLNPAGCFLPRKTSESSSRAGMGGSVWNFSGVGKLGTVTSWGEKLQPGNVWRGRNVGIKGNVWNPGNKSTPGARIPRRRSIQKLQKEILESWDKKKTQKTGRQGREPKYFVES